MYANAKTGSHPPEQSAIMLSVPVGAIVVIAAFRCGLFSFSKRLPSKLGNIPLVFPSSIEVSLPVFLINFITFSAIAIPLSEPYLIFNL